MICAGPFSLYQGQELVGEHHDSEDMEEGEHQQDEEEESGKQDKVQGPRVRRTEPEPSTTISS